MLELDQTVQKMVLESLGVRKEHVDSHLASLDYHVRLSHYGALPPTAGGDVDDEATYAVAHKDCTMVTTIAQHEVEGLEVQARDGTWISVAPEPGTFAVVAGEMLTVVTNGRVPACVHRVRTPSKRERLSALFGSSLRPGAVVSALEELVDHDRRPLRFRPCDFDEYVKFRFGQERPALNSALQEFCGIGPTK